MGGNYSRVTFKPLRDYNGVLKQQGRVGLDADHNELVEIVDRRWRAESIDIMGRDVVPVSNPENTTAFQIEVAASPPNSFMIGRGRMYVDGLLVECHGDLDSLEYDASLGEESGQGALPYEKQPYFPKAPTPPGSGSGNTDLVYIDAWEREVTAVEDPLIREIALGGPDTATRVQTVWQVRLLPSVNGAGCSDDIARWDQLIAPPTARLSSHAVQPPASDDPCVLSPTGGYRGLENRLYRVEIYDVDSGGNARFKWSRDDASILTTVETINGNQLTVQRIGRDAVLRFSIGDWVELMDDPTEFGIEPPASGFMAQVTNIDEANRIVTLSAAPPATFDATKPENHTRLRRWDQSIGVDASGVLPVATGAWIPIEDGVEVEFTPNGATYRAGDYWVFAARTADGSVEELVEAPPRGVVHHYARLALITWSQPPVVSDCRVLWPAEGCCTEVVWPGDDIQAAIDRLARTGGCVCLKAGLHQVSKPLTIPYPNICLHGESIGAVVRGIAAPTLLSIDADDVSVHDVRFEIVAARGTVSIITIEKAMNAAIHDCELVALVKEGVALAFVAGVVVRGATASIARNQISDVVVGVYAMRSGRVDLIDNVIVALSTNASGAVIPVGFAGFIAVSVYQPCRVESNAFNGFVIGAYLGELSARSIVARNRITRGDWLRFPSNLLGLIPGLAAAGQPPVFYAIDCAALGTIIADNIMNIASNSQGGVHVTATQVRVEGNQVQSELKTWVNPPPRAVFLETPTDIASVSECVVRGNLLTGVQIGVDVRAESVVVAAHVEIIDNICRAPGAPAFPFAVAIRGFNVRASRIERNDVQGTYAGIVLGGAIPMPGNIVAGNRVYMQAFAIFLATQNIARVTDNVVDGASTMGIAIGKCGWSEVANNTIDGAAVGVYATAGISTTIRGNTITDAVEGISANSELDLVVDGNRIENASAFGILTYGLIGSALRHDHLLNCAYTLPPGGLNFAASILQAFTTATATVESCDIVGTATPPGGAIAPIVTFAILQVGVTNARVRSNRIDNPVIRVPAPTHCGIRLVLGVNAEIVDNSIIGSGLQPLVEVDKLLTAFAMLRFTDVICSSNRCNQSVVPQLDGSHVSIHIAAVRLVAVGNVVRATDSGFASFLTDTDYLSAVANMTSGVWLPTLPPNCAPPLGPSNNIHVP